MSCSSRKPIGLLGPVLAALVGVLAARAEYIGSVSATGPFSVRSTATEILGSGGGTGAFTYNGGGNAIDAAVAGGLVMCVVSPASCSLGGYGGHMLIYKAGWEGGPKLVTSIDFGSPAGSLATPDMWVGSVNLTNGQWTGGSPNRHRLGWKAVGVPGIFAGLYVAQTNYGRKIDGTNALPFSEIMKTALARTAEGQVSGNSYYTLSSVSNLLWELYTNSNPYGAFYTGGIALDLVAAMQTNGGLVTYADMTNYRVIESAPFSRHFNPPNGTPGTLYVAPPGSAGLSVLQEVAMLDAIGWTNGPGGTWSSQQYWQSRGEIARLMWKDHFQWIGDPWGGVLPPDFLGNGSTNFADQLLAHITNAYPNDCPWDTNEVLLTNSLKDLIVNAVNNQTNTTISVDWDDIRYGTFHISTSDKWGNCVSMTLSMGGGYGAQVAVTNRGLVLGQGMALADPRPGWPDSIGPGKRAVDNMSPAIVVPDYPASPTNGVVGGRAPFAVGGGGGSTIENNVAMQVINYLTQPSSSLASAPTTWLYNFEANKIIYMHPSYPSGVQSWLTNAGYSAPGSPPTIGVTVFVQSWIPPEIVTQPASTNISSGSTANFAMTATGLPLFYQWFRDGVALIDGGTISGAQTPQLTLSSVTNSAGFFVVITNGGASTTSAPVAAVVDGSPAIAQQPASRTNFTGTLATFSVMAAGNNPLTYQWRKNGTPLTDSGNISGATTTQLNLDSVTAADDGTYSVIVSNPVGTATSLGAILKVTNPYLSLLWSVGPSNNQPWMNYISSATSVPNQRTIAYNPLSNHLYVISRSSNTTSNYVIYVLNATNGTQLYTLKTNGIQCNVGKGGIGLDGIAVADDGAIYACNEAPDAAGSAGADPTGFFRVYRWANASSNTSPTLIFTADPRGVTNALRWGDNLTVRGAGTNTQILVDMTYFGNTVGTNGYAAILIPTNQFMTNFSARWFATTNYSTGVGRSLEFDRGNKAIWQKEAGKGLMKVSFDPATSLGGTQISSANVLAVTNYPASLMGIGLDLTLNLAAGVFSNSTTAADSLNLYDVSDITAPVLLDQYNFPTTPRIANGNRISQTFFKNDLVFSIDANNGMMVFRIVGYVPSVIIGNVTLDDMERLSNGAFQFTYTNNENVAYRVFASTNMVDWQSIGTAGEIFPGLFQFTDVNAADITHRYYQLRSP